MRLHHESLNALLLVPIVSFRSQRKRKKKPLSSNFINFDTTSILFHCLVAESWGLRDPTSSLMEGLNNIFCYSDVSIVQIYTFVLCYSMFIAAENTHHPSS